LFFKAPIEKEIQTPKKIHSYLKTMGVDLREDYTDFKGMPEVVLKSRVKLTPKNF